MERSDRIAFLLKKALGLMEVMLTRSDEFLTTQKANEYAGIVEELNELGYFYIPNQRILSKADVPLNLKPLKKPMKKATGASQTEDSNRKISGE
ncbi:MAG: hypothetical protein NXI20_26720 [bacterium]|jgi:hypothetical protein|nr:hypothetical protein [bacterium]